MLRGLILGLVVFAFALPARAQNAIVSEHADTVTVTIYHDGYVDTADLAQNNADDFRYMGLALITETRTIDLPAGPVSLRFRDVASTMVPQTADVDGLPEKVDERNFDFNLLSPGALFAKSVGQTVHLIRTDRAGQDKEESAIVRSGPDGVVLQTGDRFEALNCAGLPERVAFDRVPDGLFDKPTLTVRTNVPKAGRYTLTLRYIATGLNWSADYVARIADDGRTLDLSGWITLANFSETGFANVPVEVIAGNVRTTGEDVPQPLPQVTRSDACWPTSINWASYYAQTTQQLLSSMPGVNELVTVTGTSIRGQAPVGANVISVDRNIVARNLADYKLYPLPEPTTVAARQTKQVQFLDKTAVPFELIYRDEVDGFPANWKNDQPLPASVVLRLHNTEKDGLGKPLPAGGVSAVANLDGGPVLLSDHETIDDTPVGSPVEISAGVSEDVPAHVKLIASTTISAGRPARLRNTMEVRVANHKTASVTYEWGQAMEPASAKLVSESRAHQEKNGELVWAIKLKPGEEVVFQYTMEGPEY